MLRPVLSLAKPLDRRTFLLAGVSLVALKVVLDLLVSQIYGRPFSLFFYVVPTGAPLFSPPSSHGWSSTAQASTGYWLTVVGCALPFIAVGVALTIRRLRDAGMSGLLAIFFFVPFVKFLFFAALSMAPTKAAPPKTFEDDAGPFRSATIDVSLEEKTPSQARRRLLALAAGTLAADAVAMAAMGVSVGLLKSYGWPLMVATPVVTGFVATTVYCRLCRPTAGGAVLVTFTTFAVGVALLGLSALEGFGCIVMLAPLFFGEALLGTLLAYNFAKTPTMPSHATGSGLVMLPLAFIVQGASPAGPEVARPIESSVVVHAPPDVVWKRVIAFPPLPAPTEAIFRVGIAAPLAATIEGVGAVRRCEFTTGAFVEPIEVWSPGRELSFRVESQPDPMKEWTLYAGPRPPHLDGYLESTRGQFVLEPLADGGTRLVGRTWYRVHMEPEGYWRIWGDAIIHAIHTRVLAHVAKLAEADARATPAVR